MQKILTKYGLALHVLCLCAWPLFHLAQPATAHMTPLLWLALLSLEFMLILPSVYRGETLADARSRVLRKLAREPLLYIGLAFVLIALMQWMNSGRELVYMEDADVWRMSAPPVSWLPSSVDSREAFPRLALWVGCSLVALAARIALARGSLWLILRFLTLLSGGVALYSAVSAIVGQEPFATLATGQHGGAMGAFFGFWMLVAGGVFITSVTRLQRDALWLFLLGFVGNLLGTILFAHILSLALYLVLAVLMLFYWLLYSATRIPKHTQVKLFAGTMLAFALIALMYRYALPDNPVATRVDNALQSEDYWPKQHADWTLRKNAALSIWESHPWVGVGPEGFAHYMGMMISTHDWKHLIGDRSNVRQDWLQFMCEYGLLGCGLMLAATIALIAPLMYRARGLWQMDATSKDGGRTYILRVPPVVLCGTLALLTSFVEINLASPFRLPGFLLSWTCVLASLPAFMPGGKQQVVERRA